ncbi:hypothetical protein L916_12902, partial [Phytophthora nicotianae]
VKPYLYLASSKPSGETLRCLASATGIPKTTLMRHLAAGVFRRATTRVKPKLTDVHKANEVHTDNGDILEQLLQLKEATAA